MLIKQYIDIFLRPDGRASFLAKLPSNACILDVGCGNNSPYKTKKILPKCVYVGIDVGDYNQIKPNLADEYIVTDGNKFTSEIAKFNNRFDAVISCHNLEHCDDRTGTLLAMLQSLKVDGQIFLSFPSEASVAFPNRVGTLNYYDDLTHKESPPSFEYIIQLLNCNKFEIIFSSKSYRPRLLAILGLFFEPLSCLTRKKLAGTWEYWGFESIIKAKKFSKS
jgi:SAM-dependent methyltransferase